MKSKLLYSVLLFMSMFVLSAQEETFCVVEEDPNSPSPVYLSPLNNSNYSGSIDPAYLTNFDPISFDIYFWIINPENDEVNYDPVTFHNIKENMIKINEAFKPMGICFVLKGYDTFESDDIYEGATMGQINNYSDFYGKVSPNSFNVYITESLNSGNGVTYLGFNKIAIKRSHFNGNQWGTIAGVILAHELGHTFYLYHPWGNNNEGSYTPEHVTRNPNNPNYNALSVADFIDDTPAQIAFWKEAQMNSVTIYDIIDPETCEYLGNETDNLGESFDLTPTDTGNVMGGSSIHDCFTGFTTGQGIRIREWIADPTNSNYQSVKAMRNDNLGIDLYIKDSPEDFGEEPNNISPYYWDSPNIWVRHQQDGYSTRVHQNPEYHPTNPNYVYVSVINRGCSDSNAGDKLKLYWAKAGSYMLWDQHWNGSSYFSNGALIGAPIGTITMPAIEANKEAVFYFQWVTPDPQDYSGISEDFWHYCLIARIESDDDLMTFTETTSVSQNVRKNNNIAQKNVSVVDFDPNTIGRPIGAAIAVGNPFHQVKAFDLLFAADSRETGKKIFEEAEVTITLNPLVLAAWNRGGRLGNNIMQIGGNKIIITGDEAVLQNLIFNGNEIGTLNLDFHFLTQEITEKEEYTYRVIQKHNGTNDILGGETYHIRKHPRVLFYAQTEENIQADKNEPVTLNAETINEPAVYNWYDSDGNLIYEGADFTTSVEVSKTYKLEIIALADGYKDYAEVEVSLKPNVITTLYPNPTSDEVTVSYKVNHGDSAYLAVTGFYGSNISNNYILDIEENEITLDVNSYPQGLYSVVLIVNGQIQDTTTLIKQ